MANKTAAKKVKRSSADKLFETILYLISFVLLVIVLYPLYFVVIASFSDPSAVSGGGRSGCGRKALRWTVIRRS